MRALYVAAEGGVPCLSGLASSMNPTTWCARKMRMSDFRFIVESLADFADDEIVTIQGRTIVHERAGRYDPRSVSVCFPTGPSLHTSNAAKTLHRQAVNRVH